MLATRVGVDDVGVNLRVGEDGFRTSFFYDHFHPTNKKLSLCRVVEPIECHYKRKIKSLDHSLHADRLFKVSNVAQSHDTNAEFSHVAANAKFSAGYRVVDMGAHSHTVLISTDSSGKCHTDDLGPC